METVVWSKPEEERAGTPLLVMMHGYGTDESRMVNLFDYLPSGIHLRGAPGTYADSQRLWLVPAGLFSHE